MKRTSRFMMGGALAAALLILVAGAVNAALEKRRSIDLMTSAARDFLSVLNEEQRAKTVFDFEEDSVSKTRFVESFAASVKSSQPPPVPGSYGLELLRIVLDVYQTPHATIVSSNDEVI